MTLIRYNPAREILNVEREFNKVFNSFLNKFGKDEKNEEYENAVWAPLTDVAEDDNNYYIHADLPGVAKKDLKLSFKDGQLIISGERVNEVKEDKKTYHRVERSFGRYYRSFTLPEKIVADKIEAKFEDGQLNILIPKAEEAKPRLLDIKVN